MQKLPIGIQSFSELRGGHYLYVDKTRGIHRMVCSGKYFFLSRPRRFGKSLLVSTLKELFSGNKKLFKDLWIEEQWNWEQTNPVIQIPFASLDYKVNGLDVELQKHIQEIASMHEIELENDSLKNQFETLLKKLSGKKGQLVLLIDEYDKPIIDYLGKEVEQAKANQQILKNFYSVIKDSDDCLRFVFITGISKFSKVSIFSDLNNLNDLTLDKNYSTLLGYTQEELETYFDKYVDELSREHGTSKKYMLKEIKSWYNGYSWDGREFVYNPFSVLLLFNKMDFGSYWFETATPSFLIDLLKEKMFYDLDGVRTGRAALSGFEVGKNLRLLPLLFQTGYLTIKNYDHKNRLYTLGYPNREVKEAMLEYLVDAFTGLEVGLARDYAVEVWEALMEERFDRVVEILNGLFQGIPYPLHDRKEKFYHAIVHVFFKLIGLDVKSEVNTARGRADVIIELPDKVYCLEFKMDSSARAALEQIKDKGYLSPYKESGKKLIAIGINFSSSQHCIFDWGWELL